MSLTNRFYMHPHMFSFLFFFVTAITIIYHGWLGIVGSALFSSFALFLFNDYLKNKALSIFVFLVFLFTALYFAFFFGSYVIQHFDELFNIESSLVKQIFAFLKLEQPANFDLNALLKLSLTYIKSNLGVIFSFGANSLQIVLGIIFGVLFFLYDKTKMRLENYWDEFIEHTQQKMSIFFEAFQSVLKLQLAVSVMNTFSLSILSFGIAWMVTGEFLPYWYILLPLTALLSLIPVIGNIFINLLIFLIAINISVLFSVLSLIYFFIVHKLELVVIGKMIGKKQDIPFLFVAISMLLGELFFHSMLGVLFGVVTLVALKSNLSSQKKS